MDSPKPFFFSNSKHHSSLKMFKVLTRQKEEPRVIQEEREVFFYNYSTILQEFNSVFDKIGWGSFLTMKTYTFPSLVQEFYSKFEFTPSRKVKFIMFGQRYHFTLEQFGTLLCVPSKGVEFYSTQNQIQLLPRFIPRRNLTSLLLEPTLKLSTLCQEGVLDNNVKTEFETLKTIVSYNIFFRKDDNNQVSVTELALMWCLVKSTPVNLAFIIASRMQDMKQNLRQPLPYGRRLTYLFRTLNLLPRSSSFTNDD